MGLAELRQDIFFALQPALRILPNWDISQQKTAGEEVTAEQLAALMLKLQAQGCHNINFVMPEHVAPQIVEALPLAVAGGLRLPLVYNTSAYDALSSLELMDGLVDIYMPDFKFWQPETATEVGDVTLAVKCARKASARGVLKAYKEMLESRMAHWAGQRLAGWEKRIGRIGSTLGSSAGQP